MELKVNRTDFTPKSTIGDLLIDGQWECHTLEDAVRGPGIKIPGQTAISQGRYEIIIDRSMRFKRMMPHILNVPLFEGIRIHSGNSAADTAGCILVGENKIKGRLINSRAWEGVLTEKIEAAIAAGDKVYITIYNN